MKCEKGVSSISITLDNGNQSKLFEDLYSYYNDTDKAYQAYLKTKSDMFKQSYGLTNNNTSALLDNNNEPVLLYQLDDNKYTTNREYAINYNINNPRSTFNPSKPLYGLVWDNSTMIDFEGNKVYELSKNNIIDTELSQLINQYSIPSNIELGSVVSDSFESEELNELLPKSRFSYSIVNSSTNQLYKLDNELGLVINEDYIKNNTVATYELAPLLLDYIRLNNKTQYNKIIETVESLSKYRSKQYINIDISNPNDVKEFLINLFNGHPDYDVFHTDMFNNKLNSLLNILETNVGLVLNTEKSFISSINNKSSVEIITKENNDNNDYGLYDKTTQYSETVVNINSTQKTTYESKEQLTDIQQKIKEKFDKTNVRLEGKRLVHFSKFPKKMQSTLEKVADENGNIEVYFDKTKNNFIKRRITFAQTEQFVKGKSKEEVKKMNEDPKSIRLRTLGTELHAMSENVLNWLYDNINPYDESYIKLSYQAKIEKMMNDYNVGRLTNNSDNLIHQDFIKYTGVDSPFYIKPTYKDSANENLIEKLEAQALDDAKTKFMKIVQSQMDLFLSAYSTQRDIDMKQMNNEIIEQTKINNRFDKTSYELNYKFNKPMFSIEQAILDEQINEDNSEAGRIDLVVIFSDGSASIYDHKFIEGKFKSNPQQTKYENWEGDSIEKTFDRYDMLDHEAVMEKIVKGKMKSWEMQLGRQAEILINKYGITKIRQVRIKPTFIKLKGERVNNDKTDYSNARISVAEVTYSYSGNELESRNRKNYYAEKNTDLNNLDSVSKMNLESKFIDVSRFIPMKFERSNDVSLNKFIDNLVTRINKNIRELNKSRSWSTDPEKVTSLVMLQKILTDIQLNGEIDSYLSHVYTFMENIKLRLAKDNGTYNGDYDELLSPYNLTFQDIQDAKSEIKFFQDFIKNTNSILNEMIEKDNNDKLTQILTKFGQMQLDMENLVVELNQKAFNMLLFNAKKKGMREEVFKSFDKFEDIGWLQSKLLAMKDDQHPLIQLFAKYIEDMNTDRITLQKRISTDLSVLNRNLVEWGKSRGKSNTQLYEDILNDEKNLITRFSKELYIQMEEHKEINDFNIKWWQSNFHRSTIPDITGKSDEDRFNEQYEKFQEKLKITMKVISNSYSLDKIDVDYNESDIQWNKSTQLYSKEMAEIKIKELEEQVESAKLLLNNSDGSNENYNQLQYNYYKLWNERNNLKEAYEKTLNDAIHNWRNKYDINYTYKQTIKVPDGNIKVDTVSNAYFNEFAIKSPRNPEQWYNEKYTNLLKPENKPLFEYYQYLIKWNYIFKDMIGDDFKIKSNMIPNIHKDFIDTLVQDGLSLSDGVYNKAKQYMTSITRNLGVEHNPYNQPNPDSDIENTSTMGGSTKGSSLTGTSLENKDTATNILANIDPYDTERQIPIMFMDNIGTTNKSIDLSKNLLIFATFISDYTHAKQLKNVGETIRQLLIDTPVVMTSKGQKITDVTDMSKFKTSNLGMPNRLKMLDSLVSSYVYGDNNQSDPISEALGSKGTRVAQALLNFSAKKNMAFNTLSVTAGHLNAIAQMRIEATREKYFNSSQLNKAHTMYESFNPIMAFSSMFFELGNKTDTNIKSDKVSINSMRKHFSQDLSFIFQRWSDEAADNTILCSMMQNHGIDPITGIATRLEVLIDRYKDHPIYGEYSRNTDIELINGSKSNKNMENDTNLSNNNNSKQFKSIWDSVMMYDENGNTLTQEQFMKSGTATKFKEMIKQMSKGNQINYEELPVFRIINQFTGLPIDLDTSDSMGIDSLTKANSERFKGIPSDKDLLDAYIRKELMINGVYYFPSNPNLTTDEIRNIDIREFINKDNMKLTERYKNTENDELIKASIRNQANKIKDELLNKNKLTFNTTRNKSIEMIGRIKGSITEENKSAYRATLLGRFIGQYRSWMPATINIRLKGEEYNTTMDEYEYGRTRMMFALLRDNTLSTMKSIMYGMIPFKKYNWDESFNPIIQEYYEQFIQNNPDLKDIVSFENYLNEYKANMKANMKELKIFLALLLLGILLSLAFTDDEEESYILNSAKNVVERTQMELGFYVPGFGFFEQFKIFEKSPVPVVNEVNDAYSFFTNTGQEVWDILSGTALDKTTSPTLKGENIINFDERSDPKGLFHHSAEYLGLKHLTDLIGITDMTSKKEDNLYDWLSGETFYK